MFHNYIVIVIMIKYGKLVGIKKNIVQGIVLSKNCTLVHTENPHTSKYKIKKRRRDFCTLKHKYLFV